jgi:hypothetical protein
MQKIRAFAATVIAILAIAAHAQEKPQLPVTIPEPGVPQAMLMEAKFVRAAYNNEAYVIMGYQVSNRSIGDEHMMIDLGTTVMAGVPAYNLTRDKIEVTLPDGTNMPLLSMEDFRKVDLRPIESRARVQRDSINYFPNSAHEACRIGFFAEPNSPAMAWDVVELSSRRACLGRLFFKIPGGIKYGQYFLNVKFAKTQLRVPFRIMTEEEEKFLGKNYKAIDKQIDEAFRPKKKK